MEYKLWYSLFWESWSSTALKKIFFIIRGRLWQHNVFREQVKESDTGWRNSQIIYPRWSGSLQLCEGAPNKNNCHHDAAFMIMISGKILVMVQRDWGTNSHDWHVPVAKKQWLHAGANLELSDLKMVKYAQLRQVSFASKIDFVA